MTITNNFTLRTFREPLNAVRDWWESDKRLEVIESTEVFLGLDLGLHCGYCFATFNPKAGLDPMKDVHFFSGQLDLTGKKYETAPMRFVKMREFLCNVKPTLVAYEEVKYTPPEAVTQYNAMALLGRAATTQGFFEAMMMTVSTYCESATIPATSFPIGTIKKRATGKGNANKAAVIKACNEQFGYELDPDANGHDNVADATFVALLAVEDYCNA